MFATSKVSDAQSAYESVMTMLPAVLGRVHFILHAAGWLEGGMVAGYEKFVMDCEMLGMFHTLSNGIDFSEEGQAMDSLRSVEPGGHHLGTKHTMRNFHTAFYRSELFDYKDVDQWVEDGSVTAEEAATARYKELLAAYEAPPLDEKLDQELLDFIAKRKREISEES